MRNNRRHRIVAAVASLILASASAIAVAPGADAQEAVYEFVPVRLITHDIEDWWPDWQDEIRMYYGSERFSASTWNGDKTYPGRTAFVGSSLRVELWEWDRGRDNNFLGEHTVTATNLGLEKSVHFFRPGDYHYQLIYRVVRR